MESHPNKNYVSPPAFPASFWPSSLCWEHTAFLCSPLHGRICLLRAPKTIRYISTHVGKSVIHLLMIFNIPLVLPVPSAPSPCPLVPNRSQQCQARARRNCHSLDGALTRQTGASRSSPSAAGWSSPPGTQPASCRPRWTQTGVTLLRRRWASCCSWRCRRGCWRLAAPQVHWAGA